MSAAANHLRRVLRSALGVVLVTATLTVGVGGCYRHTYYEVSTVPSIPAADWRWHHHLLWGLISLSEDVPLDRICPMGVSRIENWIGPLQWILTAITSGIYTPTTVRVFCRSTAPAAPTVPAEQPVDVKLELTSKMIDWLQYRYPDLEDRIAAALADAAATDQAAPSTSTSTDLATTGSPGDRGTF